MTKSWPISFFVVLLVFLFLNYFYISLCFAKLLFCFLESVKLYLEFVKLACLD